MKRTDKRGRWYFVDEAGDPVFYGKGKKIIVGNEGCSRTFSVGYLWTLNPEHIRNGLQEVRCAIANDLYLKDIPSIQKSLVAFHAKDDCPEVRHMVFTALSKMDFRVHVVVARKHESQFREHFKQSQDCYYDFLVAKLFWNQLHVFKENTIVFSRRGAKSRQSSLRVAVDSAVLKFQQMHKDARKTKISVESKFPSEDAALQAADYVMWTIQRAFERREMRYFEFVRDKFHLIWDIFDITKKKNGGKTIYNKSGENLFDIEKASPLS